MKAVVLAAGYGKRLMPLTANRPKHVLPLAGKPLIMTVVESIARAGITDIGIVVGYRSEEIMNVLKKLDWVDPTYIYQNNIGGTGAALKECKDYLAGEDFFLVVYGDLTVDDKILRELLDFFNQQRLDGVLAAVEADETSAYGVVDTFDGLLVKIGEKEQRPGPVNAGIYVLSGSIFEFLERVGPSVRGEVELTDALNRFVAEGGRIGVKFFEKGWWFDIGRPKDYLAANHVYLRKFYGDGIVVGKNVFLGDGVLLEGPVYIGSHVKIGDRCIVQGPAMICEGTTVDKESIVKNSVILERCVIGAFSKIYDAIICEESRLTYGVEVLSEGFPAYVSHPGTLATERNIV